MMLSSCQWMLQQTFAYIDRLLQLMHMLHQILKISNDRQQKTKCHSYYFAMHESYEFFHIQAFLSNMDSPEKVGQTAQIGGINFPS